MRRQPRARASPCKCRHGAEGEYGGASGTSLRRGAAAMAGGHDGRRAVAQADNQERSVNPYPISLIPARSSRAGKLQRGVFAGKGGICTVTQQRRERNVIRCSRLQRGFGQFWLLVLVATGRAASGALPAPRSAPGTRAEPAEIDLIATIHRVPTGGANAVSRTSRQCCRRRRIYRPRAE